MADAIDWEASGSRSVLAKPPEKTKAQKTRDAWIETAEEIRTETGIPFVSYAYFDTRNEFTVILRGTADRIEYVNGREIIRSRGVMPGLSKDFTFKGEGKSPYANRTEMEKWTREIYKWAKSLDGRKEIEAAGGPPVGPTGPRIQNGTPTETKAV